MLPILQIGPAAVPTPGLILLLGLWLGLTLAERLAVRFESDANTVYNLAFTALLAGMIGARLSFVAQNAAIFLESPLNIFSRNLGLFDPIGGVAIGVLAALIYGNRKSLPLWETLDALTPLLAVFAIALGLTHFASGDAFGTKTALPWGIDLWGAKRHPTQIYETILAILILWGIWPRRSPKGKTHSRVAGETFWRFLALSAGARLLIEGWRGDSMVLSGGIRVAQLAAWGILALSLWMHYRSTSEEN